MRHGHFEMVRLTIGRKMDTSRMFTMWRVEPPWQPVTKKVTQQSISSFICILNYNFQSIE